MLLLGAQQLRSAPRGAEFLLCDTPKRIEWLFAQLREAPEYSWDIETTHPTAPGEEDAIETDHDEKVIGISFSWRRDLAAYLPLFRNKDGEIRFHDRASFDRVVADVKRELEDPSKRRITWNGIFDHQWVWWCLSIWVPPCWFDGMLAHHLLDEERRECDHRLKKCAAHYCDPMAAQFEQQLQEALDFYDPSLRRYSSVPVDVIFPYGCGDALYTLELKDVFMPRLQQEGLLDLFFTIVMPMHQVIIDMQVTGVPVDRARVELVRQELTKEIAEVNQQIWGFAGHEFDVGSAEQLSGVLFGEMKLRVPAQSSKGKAGYYGTNKEVLAALEDEHPVIKLVQRHRRIVKLLGTYVEGLDKLLVGDRYFQNYKIHGTVTGRLSERLVVLLPRGEKGGDAIKGLFCAPDGWSFVFRDLGQAELRVAAHVSQDPIMLDGYRNGGSDFDLHAATAVRMFNLQIPPGENQTAYVKQHFKQYRSISKNLVFGCLFGASAKRIMTLINQEYPEMNCTIDKAQEFLDQYFATMVGLRDAINLIHRQAKHYGYVVDIFGRRRRLPDAQTFVPPRSYQEDRPRSGPLRWCYARESPSLTHDLGQDVRESPTMQTDTARALVLGTKNPKFLHDREQRKSCVSCSYLVPCMYAREYRQRVRTIEEALRQAFNFVIQGSAVDYANLSIAQICQEIGRLGMRSRPVLQIHDSVGFLVPDDELEPIIKLTKDRMEHAYPLSVPMGSEVSVGRSWGDENLKVPKKCGRCKADVKAQTESELRVGEVSRYRAMSAACGSCGWTWRHGAVFTTELN